MTFHVTLYNGVLCVVHRSLCLRSPRFRSLFANHEAVLCGHKEQPPLSALYRALRTRYLQWRRQANTSLIGFLFGWWYQACTAGLVVSAPKLVCLDLLVARNHIGCALKSLGSET